MTDMWQFIAIGLSGVIWLIAFGLIGSLLTTIDSLKGRVRSLEAVLADEPRCRVCGCTDDVACTSGCWWAEEDLCSSCADDQAMAGDR